MKRFITGLTLALVVVLETGCASKITSVFTPPQDATYDNIRVFNAPYDKVWKTVIDTVGESFFVLENLEKDSGIMSLSFSARRPADYVDCGLVTDTGTITGKAHAFSFKGAEARTPRMQVLDNGIPVQTLRTFKLSGKANILIKKISDTSTQVRINTRYVADLIYSGNEVIVVGYNTFNRPFSTTNTMIFTSKEAGQFDTLGSLTCKSTMDLENDILNNIEKQLAP